jgi:hypothetical protein
LSRTAYLIGFNIGPITPSTRRVYEKKLVNLLKADGSDAYFIEDDTLDQSNASQNGLSRRSSSPEVQIVFQSPTELNGNESHVQEKVFSNEYTILFRILRHLLLNQVLLPRPRAKRLNVRLLLNYYDF